MCAQRWEFPFDAEYVYQVEGNEVRQTVTVLERFGQMFRVQAQNELWIKGIGRPLRPGQTICVEAPAIEGR